MKTEILALHVQPECAARLRQMTERLGHSFYEPPHGSEKAAATPACNPDLVLLETSGRSHAWITRRLKAIKKRFPGARAGVLASPAEIKQAMADLPEDVDEFLEKPVEEAQLRVVLRRTSRMAACKARIRQLEAAAEEYPESRISHLLETERFVVVKQLVDKMSHFIGQIARDVEDGVRYFHSTPYFVSIHNCDLKVVANDAMYQRYFGNKVGANSWEIYHGKAADPEHCPVGKTLQTGMVQRTQAVARYAGGKKAPVIVHTAPIYNNNGKMELILEVSAGSREIRRLRKELRTTQQKYQKLFDEVPDYIAVLDRRFRITAINRRFQEEFGDRTGDPFFDIFPKKHFSENRCPLSQTLQDGRAHHVETELVTFDNRKFNVILSTAPVNDIGSHIFQVIVIFKDITRLRRLEDHLSTLGLMFGVISHNIKGVLTGLDAGLYLIDHGFYKNVPGRIEEGLEVATLMTERIRKLVLDVLYYAKPRELQLEPVDVAQLAEDVCQQLRPKMGARNIEFVCDIDPEAGRFEVDREIFRSVLVNLLENAMEACMDPRLERALRVRFAVRQDRRHRVCFEVEDNGPGLDPEQQEKIFSKFYSTKGHRGTGLGLFIARKVVEQHGGEIGVASEPGAGCRFTVIMPASPAAAG